MTEEKLSSIGRRVACAALRKLNENGGKMNSADLFVAAWRKTRYSFLGACNIFHQRVCQVGACGEKQSHQICRSRVFG